MKLFFFIYVTVLKLKNNNNNNNNNNREMQYTSSNMLRRVKDHKYNKIPKTLFLKKKKKSKKNRQTEKHSNKFKATIGDGLGLSLQTLQK